MTPTREAMVRALVDSDIRTGLGDPVQVDAWRELEWRRCAADPVYWLEHYAFIILKDGNVVRMKLWPKQKLLVRLLAAGKSFCAVKARQLGVTTVLVNFRGWKTIFKDAAKGSLVSDTEKKGKEAMSRLSVTLDRLPQWMKDRASSKAKSSDVKRKDRKESTLGISFGHSQFEVLPSTPNNVAGVSGDVDLDEFGRHKEQKRILDNAIPAWEGGGQMSIVGNGNGEDHFFHTYYQAKRGEFPGMEAFFFSWKDDPTRVTGENAPYLIDIGTDGFEAQRKTYYTEGDPVPEGKEVFYPWYETTKKKYLREDPEHDIFSFKAQYPSTEEEAFYLNTESFFGLTLVNGLSRLTHNANAPRARSVSLINAGEDAIGNELYAYRPSSKAPYRLYADPKPDAYYILGIDPVSGSTKGDFASGLMCEFLRSGKEVLDRARKYGYFPEPIIDGNKAFEFTETSWALDLACVYHRRMEPVGMAYEMERFARHYNQAFMVIESNTGGGGKTVISHIKDSYGNLYRQVKHDKFADDYGEVIGFWETGTSRQEMLNTLRFWLMNGWIFLHDAPTIAELARFGYDEQGKLTAPKGLHDDLIFALGMCVVGARDLQVKPDDTKLVNFGLEW